MCEPTLKGGLGFRGLNGCLVNGLYRVDLTIRKMLKVWAIAKYAIPPTASHLFQESAFHKCI